MSWPYKILGCGLALADAVVPKGLLPGTAPDALIAAAGADPGPQSREGLRRLIASIDASSELSFFGQVSLRWDMIRLLRNAQLVEDAHRANPALGQAPVETPIFIFGLPRSGTTFLHTLMAEDSDNLVPRCWQTIYPGSRPVDFDPAKDKRARTVAGQLKLFAGLAPGFAQQHPVGADSPQECCEITAAVFQSLRFATTFRVPDYFTWLEANGHRAAFEYHRKFLQYLQNGEAGRWVLKYPDHTFALDAILQTYPDARFVIVHRDPMAVIGSMAHLTGVLRKPFVKNVDPAEIGAHVSERWIEGSNLLLEFGKREDIAAERKIHLHYEELTRAPLTAIAQIYARFDMALRPAALTAMARRIEARPRGGYGKHAPYSLEAFKINAPALKARFAPYIRQYCTPGTPL